MWFSFPPCVWPWSVQRVLWEDARDKMVFGDHLPVWESDILFYLLSDYLSPGHLQLSWALPIHLTQIAMIF